MPQRIRVEGPHQVPSGVFCSPDKRTLYVRPRQGDLVPHHKKCKCKDCGWVVPRDGVEYWISKSDWIPCLHVITEAKDVPAKLYRTPEGDVCLRVDSETVRVRKCVETDVSVLIRLDDKCYCIPYKLIPVVSTLV